MADSELVMTDSQIGQLMDDLADCLGPDLINELMYEAQQAPSALTIAQPVSQQTQLQPVDNELVMTDSEIAQLMDDVADCLGPELINELIYGAQSAPTAPLEPELMPARETQFAVAPSNTAMHQQTTQLQPVASTSSVPPLIPLHVT